MKEMAFSSHDRAELFEALYYEQCKVSDKYLNELLFYKNQCRIITEQISKIDEVQRLNRNYTNYLLSKNLFK